MQTHDTVRLFASKQEARFSKNCIGQIRDTFLVLKLPIHCYHSPSLWKWVYVFADLCKILSLRASGFRSLIFSDTTSSHRLFKMLAVNIFNGKNVQLIVILDLNIGRLNVIAKGVLFFSQTFDHFFIVLCYFPFLLRFVFRQLLL